MASPRPRALGAHEIRRRFLDFFVARDHTEVTSSSLVPANDPTLLFTNAGMVQFKDVFLGRDERPYVRAASCQRCIRAGGKHNDLENVGFTPKHHTFFEMLGNFSFGDYFKRDAIRWGWEFLTEDLGLPPERLVVSVFSGEGEDAPPDDEAAELWRELVPQDRIYRYSAKDNFWMMGDVGPCGPCSEIHIYDGGRAPPDATRGGERGPAVEEDRYIELWNLVFMQYEKRDDGTMVPLPKPSVDTGAGLERIARVVAGVDTNYDTDLLRPLVEESRRLAGARGHRGGPASPFWVIADHARATAFLIADGVFPDRTGRAYVLRRIMRRAIRHGTEVGLDEPFFHHVCRVVVDCFGDVYPELRERAATIEEVVQIEEEAFRRTLDRGLRRLDAVFSELGRDANAFPPAVAADLYDTYGFPLDLTALISRERGLSLDETAAEEEVRARQVGPGGKTELGQDRAVEDVYFELHGGVGGSQFVGYDTTDAVATVLGIVDGGTIVEEASAPGEVELVVDCTPFYAEAGGQIGDTGQIVGDGCTAEVLDTRAPVGGMYVHTVRMQEGKVRVGDRIELHVDEERRNAIRRNHSATHLLHYALRTVLGPHVVQKGSLVAPDRLRFDYSHSRSLTADERAEVERLVNLEIRKNTASRTDLMKLDEAKRLGAIGLFGEKYGEDVRVVRMGEKSTELCGGTHVKRTGDIGICLVVSESSIAQGVRRIEAVTGQGALEHVQRLGKMADQATGLLHAASHEEILDRIGRLQADLKQSEKAIADLRRQLATGATGDGESVIDVDGVKLLAKRVAVTDSRTLREAADALRARLGSGVVVLGAEAKGKATVLVAVTKDLEGRVHAGKLAGRLARHVDGRGGGRPDLAQAGGPKTAGLDDALHAAESDLAEQLRG